MAEGNSIHHPAGQLKRKFPKEFNTWKGMLARCYNPRNPSYKYYGPRGIVVCDRWRGSFEAFLEDMGTAPGPDFSIDRFPNEAGNYEPGNVRWATDAQQQENTCKVRWLECDGRTLPLQEWVKLTGIPPTTIISRIDVFGWSAEEALTTIPDTEHFSKLPGRVRQVRKRERPAYTRQGERAIVRIDSKAYRLGFYGSAESWRRYWLLIMAAGYAPPDPAAN